MPTTTQTPRKNRTREEIHNRFIELEAMGWEVYEVGKKPLQSYTLEKDGEVFRSNTKVGLLDKVEHLKPAGPKKSLDQLLYEGMGCKFD